MKRIPFLFAFIFIFLSVNVFSASAADLKIGILNTQRVMEQSEKTAKFRAEFAREFEAKRQAFAERQSAAKALQDELNTKGSTMTNDVAREKLEKLRKEDRDLNRMKEEIEAELQAKEAEMTNKFLREIRDAAIEYREKEKLSLILEKSSVITSDDAIDVTDQIMKLYDSKP